MMKVKFKIKIRFISESKILKKLKIKKIFSSILKFLWDIFKKVVVGVIVKVLVDRLFYYKNRTFLFWSVK